MIDAGQKLAGRHGKSAVAIFGNAEIRGETFDSQSPVLFSPLFQNFCCLRAGPTRHQRYTLPSLS